ncbi:MAG: hypothetical protein OXI12_11940, partial [Gammaproteobacteria bacterium]|nr:hypothetical protein [Gammaproteobacteria bacterium]
MRSERLPRRRLPVTATGAWLCGAIVSVAGCGDNAEPLPSQSLVTDSAGAAIVTSPPSDNAYATIAPEPILSIGAVEGPDELLFGRIVSVALDGAGNFIVADRQSGDIRIFDAAGIHLRTLGGPGEGPGEFQALVG